MPGRGLHRPLAQEKQAFGWGRALEEGRSVRQYPSELHQLQC